MKPILRSATLSDLEILKDFQDRLVIHEKPFDPTIPKHGRVEYYNIKELIEDINVNFLVVEIEGNIVGCGFGQIRKDMDWSTNEDIGYIGLMFVDEKVRNQKLGRLIVNELIQWFKEKNVSDIRLKVYEKNINAVKAYRKYRFQNFIIEMRLTLD